jgi:hypothetical protein
MLDFDRGSASPQLGDIWRDPSRFILVEIRPPTRGSTPQCQAHRVVEIAIDKAAASVLQPSNDTFKKDAALFRR